jgi:hypothetical protein
VIESPPLLDGADHETLALVLLASAATLSGLVGTVAGTTGADGREDSPAPMPFVAVTVNVYEMPLVSPVTPQESAPVVAQVRPPGELVTV